MKRRNFLKALVGGLVAGPAVLKTIGNPPVAPPAALPLAAGGCGADIRDILTQNMLRDIQKHEDLLFAEHMRRMVREDIEIQEASDELMREFETERTAA